MTPGERANEIMDEMYRQPCGLAWPGTQRIAQAIREAEDDAFAQGLRVALKLCEDSPGKLACVKRIKAELASGEPGAAAPTPAGPTAEGT